jgi:protoheme IX farnesyltransferase
MALLRKLSTATAATTIALVVVGGIVRATGSGDACPQWPGCFSGRVLPPLEIHAIIEFSHRLVALILSVLIVATAWVAWRRERRDPAVLWTAVGAVGVLVLQSAIGAIRIETGPRALVTTLHFLTAMVLLSLVMITAASARIVRRGPGTGDDSVTPGFRRLIWLTVAITGALLLVGAYVRGEGAGLVFLDWPLMDGRFIPDLSQGGNAASFVHRVLAAIAVLLGGVLAARSRTIRHRGVRVLAWTAFGLLVVQAGLGAAAVLTALAPWSVAGHVAGSSLAWAALVALAATAHRVAPRQRAVQGEASGGRGARSRARVGAYLQLTKPDIIVLLLITTVPAMVLAEGGMPAGWLVAATLLGGTLAAAGANAINCYLDRDIDEVMARTRSRPLPTHRVEPVAALRFGLSLVAVSFVWLAVTVNLVSAVLTASAATFYVVVYTLWMKRTTPQNIVVGGAAGAVPALVGWSAVTGSVGLPAVILFAIVFMWTPPHFWALAMRHANEYAEARVPMLPALRGRRETALHILAYSVVLVAVSFLLVPVAGMGAIYVSAAAVLGAVLIGHGVRLLRRPDSRTAMNLFRFSITYLAALFAAVAVDRLVLGTG